MFCSGVFGGKLNLYIPHLQNPSNLQGRLLQIPNDTRKEDCPKSATTPTAKMRCQRRRLPKVSNSADNTNASKTPLGGRLAELWSQNGYIHLITYVPIPSLRPKAYGTDEPNQSWIPSLGDGGRGKLAPPSHTKKNRLPKKGEGNMVATTFAIQFH